MLTPEEVFRRGLVQVPEGRQLFDNMTVHENLLMGAYRRTDRLGIAESLERVYARRFPTWLSAAAMAPETCPAGSNRCVRWRGD